MKTLLSIDPGRSFTGTGKARQSIGVALFEKGECIEKLSLSFEELRSRLTLHLLPGGQLFFRGESGTWLIEEMVVEDFINNSQSKGGQRNGTSECIGMLEDRAWLTGTDFTRQRSDVLPAAKLHAPKGSFKDLKHLRHEDSAFLHGREYLIRKGVIEVDLSATM